MVAEECPHCGRTVEPDAPCDCGGTAAEDPDLDAWLLAREADLEEQAFALADQFDERWPGAWSGKGNPC